MDIYQEQENPKRKLGSVAVPKEIMDWEDLSSDPAARRKALCL